MHKIKSIGMEHDVLAENAHLAEHNHERLVAKGIRSVDVMGSIGSGKTALIIKMAAHLKEKGVGVAVIAGDVTGEDDYKRFQEAGIKAYNVNTGKECHLESNLIERTLDKMDLDGIGFIFIENVGNLVCPADFPLGTDVRMVVISVTEGDDMVRKHPMIFTSSDVAVLNKVDLAGYMEVDVEVLKSDYSKIVGNKPLYLTSVKTGEGIDVVMKAIGASK